MHRLWRVSLGRSVPAIDSFFIDIMCGLSLVPLLITLACTQDGDTLCADENKVCISTTTTTAEPATIKETCEECLDGFIEFRNVCINIENALALEDFVEEFTPVFINGSATPAERLTRLIALAKIISALNARVPPPPFTLGLNKYSADSEEERATLAGYIASLESAGDFPRFDPTTEGGFRKLQQEDLPATVNWKEMDATTIVKDQGRCGSCWALSLAATIESAAFINPDNEGFLQSFSFQQFISCNDLGINNGCGGGNTIIGMGYAALNTFGGLTSLNDYPYTDAKGDTTEQCKLEGKNVTARVERPRIVMSYDDELSFDERVVKMKEAVSRQPVSVNMKSSCDQFSSYKKGVMTDDGGCACQSVTCIDHAIVLVGYDDTADNRK